MTVEYHRMIRRHARIKLPRRHADALIALLDDTDLSSPEARAFIEKLIVESPPPADMFQCPQCHELSPHPDDKSNGYCGTCHDWTGVRESEVTVTDDLRAAAARLREIAAKATQGKWTVEILDQYRCCWVIHETKEYDGTTFGTVAELESINAENDACWIAAMGPDKAELIARMLDTANDAGPALEFARSFLRADVAAKRWS